MLPALRLSCRLYTIRGDYDTKFAVGSRVEQSALFDLRACPSSIAWFGDPISRLPCGANLLDFGVRAKGGLAAGLELARITLAGRAEVSIVAGDRSISSGPWVQVTTDQPVEACMMSQYAVGQYKRASSLPWAQAQCVFAVVAKKS